MNAAATRGLTLGIVATAAVAVACASPGMPPGGPPDREPPRLMSVSPESGALNVRAKSVLLRFDEVLNERSTPIAGGSRGPTGGPTGAPGGAPGGGSGGGSVGGNFGGGFGGSIGGGTGGGGAAGIGGLILLSPSDGRERVSWRRSALEIEPRGGFRPNTTYRITLLPGLGDLRGNVIREPQEFVFSTGASMPSGEVQGVIFDWAEGRPAGSARIEAFLPGDSITRWRARADENGRFAVRDLAPGEYRLRGWLDGNGNRLLDDRELFDSLSVRVDSNAQAELYAFVHDTIGPRLESVEVLDSLTLRLRFDRPVAVDWIPDSNAIQLFTPDSTRRRSGVMIPLAQYDSLVRETAIARQARADSVADSVADRVDAAADTAAPPRDTVVAPARRPLTIIDPSEPVAAADADTTPAAPPPEMTRKRPVQVWALPIDTALAPGAYRVRALAVRGLGGARRDSERELRIRPPAPRDSTKTDSTKTDSTRTDSSVARPTTPPRPTRP